MRAAAFLALALAGCSAPPPSATGDGPTIVSLNPCADAILHEIAAPGQLLSVSHYSHNASSTSMALEDALAYPATGGTVEEVLALNPDVVVADSFLAPSTRNALEANGIALVQIGMVSSVEDSLAQIRQLAELSSQPALGDVLAAEIELALAEHQHNGRPFSTLLWQDGGIVAGEGSLAFAMMAHTGFASHSAARGLGQGAYLPLEQVLADPPEIILASGDERMLTHPVLGALQDVRYDTFDSALLYCGGPTIPRALARLTEIREALR